MDQSLQGINHFWKTWKIAEEWIQRHNAACKYIAQFDDSSLSNQHNFESENDISSCELAAKNVKKHRLKQISCKNIDFCYDDDDDDDDNEDDIEDNIDIDSPGNSYSKSSDLEFDLGDDMMAFIEKSMLHKMELQKEREKLNSEVKHVNCTNRRTRAVKRKKDIKSKSKRRNVNGNSDEYDTDVSLDKDQQCWNVNVKNHQRIEEMAILYGENAPKICGMEAAIQLSFNRLCDHDKPVYWPVIPFRP